MSKRTIGKFGTVTVYPDGYMENDKTIWLGSGVKAWLKYIYPMYREDPELLKEVKNK